MGLKFGYFYQSCSIKATNGFNLSIDGLYFLIRGIMGRDPTVFGWHGWMIDIWFISGLGSLKVFAQQFFFILTKLWGIE